MTQDPVPIKSNITESNSDSKLKTNEPISPTEVDNSNQVNTITTNVDNLVVQQNANIKTNGEINLHFTHANYYYL